MEQPKYITVEEAATMLRLSNGTVWTWCKQKRLPAFKYPGGRKWFIDFKQLEKMQKALANHNATDNY